MKKKLLARKKVKKTRASARVAKMDDVQLPAQLDEDIQLIDTDPSLMLELSRPNEFRTAIKDAKMEFVSKIKKYAQVCNIEASQVRVYFTFKNIHAKE